MSAFLADPMDFDSLVSPDCLWRQMLSVVSRIVAFFEHLRVSSSQVVHAKP